MRITARALATNSLRGLNNNLAVVTKLQNQLTSGRTISTPSDDPTGTNTSMITRQGQAANTQQARNISDGHTFLDATDSALTHAEHAIRSDPKSPSAWTLRGRCFRQKGQPDRALADLQHALEFAPDSSDVLLDVAMLYRQHGQAARCLTTLHHVLDTYPSGEEPQQVLTLEGLALLDLKRPTEAAEALASATQRGTPSVDLLYNLALAYSASGQYEQAANAANQALAVNGTHQPSRDLLAQLTSRAEASNVQRR
jgi:tetratricopeptide (TPR) repeat protein